MVIQSISQQPYGIGEAESVHDWSKITQQNSMTKWGVEPESTRSNPILLSTTGPVWTLMGDIICSVWKHHGVGQIVANLIGRLGRAQSSNDKQGQCLNAGVSGLGDWGAQDPPE